MEMHAHSSTSQGQEAAGTVDAYSLQNTRPGRNHQQPSCIRVEIYMTENKLGLSFTDEITRITIQWFDINYIRLFSSTSTCKEVGHACVN